MSLLRDPGPSLTRAPVRRDRRGLRVIRAALSARVSLTHTLSFETNALAFEGLG